MSIGNFISLTCQKNLKSKDEFLNYFHDVDSLFQAIFSCNMNKKYLIFNIDRFARLVNITHVHIV